MFPAFAPGCRRRPQSRGDGLAREAPWTWRSLTTRTRPGSRSSSHGELAGFVLYHLRGSEIASPVPRPTTGYRGHGLGGHLVQASLDAARERRLAVLPYCPFVNSWIAAHPDYANLVPPISASSSACEAGTVRQAVHRDADEFTRQARVTSVWSTSSSSSWCRSPTWTGRRRSTRGRGSSWRATRQRRRASGWCRSPPGSACAIAIGSGIPQAEPGTTQGLHLVVDDIHAAHADLTGRGVAIGPFRTSWQGMAPGPDPERRATTRSQFDDPDGNVWLVQEVHRSGPR